MIVKEILGSHFDIQYERAKFNMVGGFVLLSSVMSEQKFITISKLGSTIPGLAGLKITSKLSL